MVDAPTGLSLEGYELEKLYKLDELNPPHPGLPKRKETEAPAFSSFFTNLTNSMNLIN